MNQLISFQICSLSAVYVFCSLAWADAPLEGTKPAHCRLVWTSDPSTTALLSWSTATQGRSHTLIYSERDAPENRGVKLAVSGRYTGGTPELYYHHVQLTDLKPATAYYVKMISDDEKSPEFYFITAPQGDLPFSLIHGGDSRSDQAARRQVNTLISKIFTESYQNDDPLDNILAFAHGGDFILSGRSLPQWSTWLSDHELTTGADGRLLPLIPTRGNHDVGPIFNQVFGFPDKDLNYYAISLTNGVRLLTLNTETSTAGNQANWLKAELAQSRPHARWVLAQYHKPAFPAVKNPSGALQSWVPLFEQYSVDLVCESDGHNIKRTVPIRDGKPAKDGVVYIGEGGLGVPQRTPKTDRWFLQSPGFADSGHHVFVLNFQYESLIGECLLLDGQVRDRFTLNARSQR